MSRGIMVDGKPMRVVQVALDPFSQPVSGAELRNHALATALGRHANVRTVAIRPLCDKPNEVSESRQCPTVKRFSAAVVQRAIREIAAASPEVVVLEGIELLHLAEELRLRAGHRPPRMVVDFHNVESALLAETDTARLPRPLCQLASTLFGRRWREARQAEARAAELADQVWVCSRADADRLTLILQQNLCTKVSVAPNVVPQWCWNLLDESLAPRRIPRRLVFVGHLRYAPNRTAMNRLLSTIWPAIHARDPHMWLTIAGRRPPRSLRGRMSRTPGVELVADPVDLHAVYHDADAALIPLEQGGGSRLKVLEALALGVPVIATE